jgi:hypothetical protein
MVSHIQSHSLLQTAPYAQPQQPHTSVQTFPQPGFIPQPTLEQSIPSLATSTVASLPASVGEDDDPHAMSASASSGASFMADQCSVHLTGRACV